MITGDPSTAGASRGRGQSTQSYASVVNGTINRSRTSTGGGSPPVGSRAGRQNGNSSNNTSSGNGATRRSHISTGGGSTRGRSGRGQNGNTSRGNNTRSTRGEVVVDIIQTLPMGITTTLGMRGRQGAKHGRGRFGPLGVYRDRHSTSFKSLLGVR